MPRFTCLMIALAALSSPSRADDKAGAEERGEFLKAYRLEPGQDLKLVPMPRPRGIRAWMKEKRLSTADRLNDVSAMTFRWRDPDRLLHQSAHFGSPKGWPLGSIPRYLEMDLYEYEIEGDRELLESCIPGDWVYREGVSPEKKAHALQDILRKALDPKIAVEIRLVERNVIVVRGEYRYTPIGPRTNNHVEIYGKEIVEGGGGAGGGGGTFPEFLKWVGAWIETPLVSEVAIPPNRLQWSYNRRQTKNAKEEQEDHDGTLVLKHLHEQTGLTFTPDRRDIRVLVIERAE